jgi:poly(A) polymerase/tRNA nucleotidyltransferase (CCA-adding enzyme)
MGRTDATLTPTAAPWLADPDTRQLCAALGSTGQAIYFVGGCVRNALLGLPTADLDLSTDALPERVIALAEAAGLKAVPTGIEHGTVTVVVQGRPFEVTTFRRDVETDGRHAVVTFSDDITEDARRRDFTMNALYATPEGEVVDPLGGLPDLKARRVRFIEDPSARIREDYLRVLRFFRFSAVYGDPALGFDAEALAAIAENLDGLAGLSAERVGHEMRRLLAAEDPAPALAAMRQVGVLAQIMPGADDRFIGPLVHLEKTLGIEADWRTRLALLGGEEPMARLRLSRVEAKVLEALKEAGYGTLPLPEVAYREGAALARQALLMRASLAGQVPIDPMLETLTAAASATFPVKARDLMPRYKGPELGARLRELEAAWIASGFALSKAALLDRE